MRLAKPRIAPLRDDEMTDDQREALAPMVKPERPMPNIFLTFARSPKALTRFQTWAGYVLSRRNSLPPREREIVILRVAFVCRSGYEFSHHTKMGLNAGLTAGEIDQIKGGPDAGWSPADAVLLRAADELVNDQFVSDPTWETLRSQFDEKQCMDLVFTVGQYTQLSMFLNTFGVQLEGGTLDPDLRQ